MKHFVAIVLFFVLLLFTSKKNTSSNVIKTNKSVVKEAAASAVEVDATATEIALSLDTLFNQLHLTRNFNGAVLVAKNGKVLYDTVIGYSNVKLKTSLPEDPIFQLASVSKQFTAYAILILQKRGLINVEKEVSEYITGFPYAGVTVKMLLTHTSGLPNYIYFWDQFKLNTNGYISNEEVINAMLTYKPAPYLKPNVKYNYSNTNYTILAYLVEKLSNKTYADFMANEVFEPLGMKNTYVWQPELKHINCVVGNVSTKKLAENDCYDGVTGDKGILSTTNDLLLWDKALYGNTILNADELADAFTNQNTQMKHRKAKYGYGWRISEDVAGNKLVWHGGWWHGFNTYIGRREQDKTCVIILSNISNKSFFTSKGKVWDIVDRRSATSEGMAMDLEE
jgi:CubicO group peptidase (beta-lactamase class C family)